MPDRPNRIVASIRIYHDHSKHGQAPEDVEGQKSVWFLLRQNLGDQGFIEFALAIIAMVALVNFGLYVGVYSVFQL